MLGLYIHIPFCKSRCYYCSFVSSTDDEVSQKLYVRRVTSEIIERKTTDIVDTIYFGGGTPSTLYVGGIGEIMQAITANFTLAKDIEVTAECNPGDITLEKLQELRGAGVNRLSVGVQSCDNKLLSLIGRRHSYAEARLAVALAKQYFDNISIDLMIGLPEQTLDMFRSDLVKALNFGATHISLYALKLEEGTKLYNEYVENDDLAAEMYEIASEELPENGYYMYEVSNFAQKGYESRHNLKYWTMEQYLGFGVSAHSYYGGVRIANTSNKSKYYVSSDCEKIVQTAKDTKNDFVMLALRTSNGINFDKYSELFGSDIRQDKAGEIAKLVKLGAIDVTEERLKICPKFMYVMNSIIIELID